MDLPRPEENPLGTRSNEGRELSSGAGLETPRPEDDRLQARNIEDCVQTTIRQHAPVEAGDLRLPAGEVSCHQFPVHQVSNNMHFFIIIGKCICCGTTR